MGASHDDAYKRIADLAREMSEHPPSTSVDAFAELVTNAVRHIPAAQYAGITVVSRSGEVATPAATGEHPRTLDALQHKFHQGACFDAATDRDSYVINNLRTDTRWPLFCPEALARTPIESIAAYQLFTTREGSGALNLYAETADAFDQHDRDLGYIFAAHAATVWAAVHRDEHFRSALASRDIIGQAKGMIMERYDLGAVAAFELLRALSQDTNVRLADVARRLVDNDHPTDTP